MATDAHGAEWDAGAYNRLNNPMQSWGEVVVASLSLRGDETALDLGCGSGRLTEFLLRRLPEGRVIAVDRSANMLESARAHLESEFDGRVDYVQASLDDIDFDGVAELAFSNAAFHWIKDHPKLFAAIFRAMKPGAWLVAQCGGGPNIQRLRERAARIMAEPAFKSSFGDWTGPWEFASPETMEARLRTAGFEDIETSMFAAPVDLVDRPRTRDYFEKVIFGTHLDRIGDPALQAEFLDRLADQSAGDDPPFRQDYWRLNLRARKPAS